MKNWYNGDMVDRNKFISGEDIPLDNEEDKVFRAVTGEDPEAYRELGLRPVEPSDVGMETFDMPEYPTTEIGVGPSGRLLPLEGEATISPSEAARRLRAGFATEEPEELPYGETAGTPIRDENGDVVGAYGSGSLPTWNDALNRYLLGAGISAEERQAMMRHMVNMIAVDDETWLRQFLNQRVEDNMVTTPEASPDPAREPERPVSGANRFQGEVMDMSDGTPPLQQQRRPNPNDFDF